MRARARREAQLLAAAELGRAIGAALPSRFVVHHEVKHLVEHAPRPVPVRILARIANSEGELWQSPAVQLGREQRHLVLHGVPICWITGNREDNVLGETRIELVLEY